MSIHRGDTLTYHGADGRLGLFAGLGVDPHEAYVPRREDFARMVRWALLSRLTSAMRAEKRLG